MDVRQLETFLWIARLGSISAACRRLNVTQSTLSMRIRALETDLRVRLFERAHKQLTLTAKGRDLVRYAERILGTVEQARLAIGDPKSQSGTLHVGVAELIALTWLPELLRRLRAQFPQVVLDLDVGIPRPMMDGLTGGKLDVVLAPVLAKPAAPVVGVPLGSVTYSWMASPELGLPDKLVTPAQLENVAIIGIASNQSVFYPQIAEWFAEDGASIQRLNICNSLGTSAAMVMAGIGVSLLPHAYFAPLIKAGKLKALRTNRRFDFQWYAMCRGVGDQALPKVVADLARTACAFRGAWANPSRGGKRTQRAGAPEIPR